MNDMNDPKRSMDDDRDDVAPLIRLAGAREGVDAGRQTAAHEKVAAHWQAVVHDRSVRRRTINLKVTALAASLVTAAIFGFAMIQPGGVAPASTVADVNRVMGEAWSDGVALERGQRLERGAVIETRPEGRLALDLEGGQVMRVDHDSRLVALGDSRFRLDRGAVYVDSADSAPSASVFIETPFGIASDVGTQFQVRVSDDSLLLGVREGLVALERADQPQLAVTVGRILELNVVGEMEERDTDRDSEIWNWISDITPVFDIDGKTLHAYLNWYVREKGLALEWHDRESESRAAAIELSGSIEGLSLEDGLENVSKIAPFSYEQRGQSLAVRVD